MKREALARLSTEIKVENMCFTAFTDSLAKPLKKVNLTLANTVHNIKEGLLELEKDNFYL